jgi:hypothetical protein
MGPKFKDLVLSFLQEAHKQHPDLLDIDTLDDPKDVEWMEQSLEFDDSGKLVEHCVIITYRSRLGWLDQLIYPAAFAHLVYDLSQV